MAQSFADLMKSASKSQEAEKKEQQKAIFGAGFNKKTAQAVERNVNFEEKKFFKTTDENKAELDKIAQKIEEDAQQLKVQAAINIAYDEWQIAAVNGLPRNKFATLVGSAGTGKTTVTRAIVEEIAKQFTPIDVSHSVMVRNEETGKLVPARELEDKEILLPPMAFIAFTGRAVQQIKRALPAKWHPLCQTAHSLLGYHPEWFEEYDDKGNLREVMRFVPYFTAANKLPYKCIIIDEGSMFVVELWNRLIEALPEDCRIYIVGDMQQLPPVHGRSILGYFMTKYPVFELKQIHRQAADNPIIATAHKILNGEHFQRSPGKFDIVYTDDALSKAHDMLMLVIKGFYKKAEFNPINDGIIVPTNKGITGQQSLNEQLVTFFNPEKRVDGVIVNKRINIKAGRNSLFLAEGDKVMLLQNDNSRGLTNGMVGIITSIKQNGHFRTGPAGAEIEDLGAFIGGDDKEASFSAETMMQKLSEMADLDDAEVEKEKESQRQASHITTVKFADGQEVSFQTAGNYGKITHAYAFTCHKSQGGEYPTVIIFCHSANSVMLSREWLYTAVTRARERVILVGNQRGISQALNRQMVKGRTLPEKIANFVRWSQEAKDDQIPYLPEQQSIKQGVIA